MSTDENSLGNNSDQLMDEVEKLIWAFLDGRTVDDDVKRFEELLKENEEVRSRYLQCAQIHSDLYSHYRTDTSTQAEAKSPVLGFLGDFSTFPENHSPSTD